MKRIERNEGWALPASARKDHYFRDGRSLCGNWGFFGTTEGPVCTGNPKYVCAKCWRLCPQAK